MGGGEYGNALLVRGELVDVVELPMPAVGEDRMAILARIVDATDGRSGTEWCVAVTHLQNQRRGRPDEAPGQLEVVLDALDRLAASALPAAPAVLMGDLNMGPDRVEPLLAARGYGWAAASPTFPSHRPREHIDWIAVRGARIDAVMVPDVRVSDHRPMVAQVQADALHMDGPSARP